MTLGTFLEPQTVSADDVGRYLEDLSPGDRRGQCLGLKAGQQRRLWEIAIAADLYPSGDLVSDSSSVFAGRNSLATFSRFEKWFASQEGAVVGCNRHFLRPLIGPGYFTVRTGQAGPLEFDYADVPRQAPPGWPAVRANSGGLARSVYGDLLDRVVWLTADVLVGAAFRRGRSLDSYFVLVRSQAR